MMKILLVLLVVVGHTISWDEQQQAALITATSDFARRLHRHLTHDFSTMVFSPFSVHASLAMAYLGARGKTAHDMSRVLKFGLLPGSTAHDAYSDMVKQLETAEDVKIEMASAMFVNPTQPVEKTFKDEVKAKYSAWVDNHDVATPDLQEKAINDYVARETEDKIKDMIPKGTFTAANTGIILVSALWFNGSWMEPFDKVSTRKEDFSLTDGSKTQVEMMNDDRIIRYKQDEENLVDVIEIPFKGERFGLYIALPRQKDGIFHLETQVTMPGKMDELWKGMIRTWVQVSIPKFRIDSKWKLKNHLDDMGMDKAFNPTKSDFTGITHVGNLHISEVFHEAVIDVHEAGVAEAATTSRWSNYKKYSMNVPMEKFIADHPFMFFLRDNLTKEIMLQGKYSG